MTDCAYLRIQPVLDQTGKSAKDYWSYRSNGLTNGQIGLWISSIGRPKNLRCSRIFQAISEIKFQRIGPALELNWIELTRCSIKLYFANSLLLNRSFTSTKLNFKPIFPNWSCYYILRCLMHWRKQQHTEENDFCFWTFSFGPINNKSRRGFCLGKS